MEEYKKYWIRFANFSGRATRKEYWLPVLFNFVLSSLIVFINKDFGSIFSIITFIPSISNGVRRLHDINKSGFNLLWIFVPIVGPIMLLIYMCTASVADSNYPDE